MWKGTRPYQKVPMQWSCHRQDVDGTLTQLPPFLDTTGQDPRRAFAESLIAAVGDTGMILVYNATFERGVITQLAELFDDLAPTLEAIARRLFDLLPLARAYYYHPAMMGSWSIKRVLPTIAPDLDYANLESVQSGDMVEPVYFEMVDAGTAAERKSQLKEALLTYCERDTLGMVKVAEFSGRPRLNSSPHVHRGDRRAGIDPRDREGEIRDAGARLAPSRAFVHLADSGPMRFRANSIAGPPTSAAASVCKSLLDMMYRNALHYWPDRICRDSLLSAQRAASIVHDQFGETPPCCLAAANRTDA